ncbi:hypothetical protein, partial [Tahibacter sp.]|uniref:hypothetical protein n=1 Tax=Tahibacter sp. TaxID=2056211 RepID=UPI0028C381C0
NDTNALAFLISGIAGQLHTIWSRRRLVGFLWLVDGTIWSRWHHLEHWLVDGTIWSIWCLVLIGGWHHLVPFGARHCPVEVRQEG